MVFLSTVGVTNDQGTLEDLFLSGVVNFVADLFQQSILGVTDCNFCLQPLLFLFAEILLWDASLEFDLRCLWSAYLRSFLCISMGVFFDCSYTGKLSTKLFTSFGVIYFSAEESFDIICKNFVCWILRLATGILKVSSFPYKTKLLSTLVCLVGFYTQAI